LEDLKDLRVWRKSHELTLEVCQSSRAFSKDEIYELTSQIRRAAASVGANIGEGCGRRFDPEMKRFVQIARGSANGFEYHLLLARDLQFARRVQGMGCANLRSPTNVGGASPAFAAPGFSSKLGASG